MEERKSVITQQEQENKISETLILKMGLNISEGSIKELEEIKKTINEELIINRHHMISLYTAAHELEDEYNDTFSEDENDETKELLEELQTTIKASIDQMDEIEITINHAQKMIININRLISYIEINLACKKEENLDE